MTRGRLLVGLAAIVAICIALVWVVMAPQYERAKRRHEELGSAPVQLLREAEADGARHDAE